MYLNFKHLPSFYTYEGFDQWKSKADSRLELLETKVDENSKMIKENSKNTKNILGCSIIQQEMQ